MGGLMLVITLLASIWAVLMLRSCLAEYQYYQGVKAYEPELWQQLGAPSLLKTPFVFISPRGVELLKTATNTTVQALAKKHRQTGLQFFVFVAVVLTVAIIYLKTA